MRRFNPGRGLQKNVPSSGRFFLLQTVSLSDTQYPQLQEDAMNEFYHRSPLETAEDDKNWALVELFTNFSPGMVEEYMRGVFQKAAKHKDDEGAVKALAYIHSAVRECFLEKDKGPRDKRNRSIGSRGITTAFMQLSAVLPEYDTKRVKDLSGSSQMAYVVAMPVTRAFIYDQVGFRFAKCETEEEANDLLIFLCTVSPSLNIGNVPLEQAGMAAERLAPYLNNLPAEKVGKGYLFLDTLKKNTLTERLNSPHVISEAQKVLWRAWSESRGEKSRSTDIRTILERGIEKELTPLEILLRPE